MDQFVLSTWYMQEDKGGSGGSEWPGQATLTPGGSKVTRGGVNWLS